MITLKQALQLDEAALQTLKAQIRENVQQSNLNAYIGDIVDTGTGIPILIKDNINVKNQPLTCASNILKGYVAPYNATVIDRLAAHKMNVFGRANMDEFAMGSTTESSCYGKTLNPKALDRVPGGSSGGSAAAVAGGLAVAALGSDTGGSIRQPAGFCGCVGLKPTYGRVSRYGLVAYASSLDQIGPITQNVTDAAILLDCISGHDPKDSTSANLSPTQTYANLNAKRTCTIAILPDLLKDASSEIQQSWGTQSLKKRCSTPRIISLLIMSFAQPKQARISRDLMEFAMATESMRSNSKMSISKRAHKALERKSSAESCLGALC